jgi:hypothetical protein
MKEQNHFCYLSLRMELKDDLPRSLLEYVIVHFIQQMSHYIRCPLCHGSHKSLTGIVCG